ncbi:hypothetical protein ACN42_g2205 [Penicillium freii]|uniref:Uncharacterized protein n=1 Tax=Penicillium freii TaxID=48697 RepID=A0A117NR50_PENFR|nr:hypothetical protein ACN42_g2205 [Penicillium freii]
MISLIYPQVLQARWRRKCHITHYIYRSLDYLSIMLRYSGLFCLVCNSPVQGQVITRNVLSVVLDVELDNPKVKILKECLKAPL